jgi:hypothetical protein
MSIFSQDLVSKVNRKAKKNVEEALKLLLKDNNTEDIEKPTSSLYNIIFHRRFEEINKRVTDVIPLKEFLKKGSAIYNPILSFFIINDGLEWDKFTPKECAENIERLKHLQQGTKGMFGVGIPQTLDLIKRGELYLEKVKLKTENGIEL